MIQRAMTAEQFSEQRSELPDAGQWAELVRGVPVVLEPPDLEHGTIVLNFSKIFSAYVHAELNGYPCFDLGLHLESSPDTVLFPAISYFIEGKRFAEADNDYTKSTPEIVIELATSNDRRSSIGERVSLYHKSGVKSVWIVDANSRVVHVMRKSTMSPKRYEEDDILDGSPELHKLKITVEELFREPDWI